MNWEEKEGKLIKKFNKGILAGVTLIIWGPKHKSGLVKEALNAIFEKIDTCKEK